MVIIIIYGPYSSSTAPKGHAILNNEQKEIWRRDRELKLSRKNKGILLIDRKVLVTFFSNISDMLAQRRMTKLSFFHSGGFDPKSNMRDKKEGCRISCSEGSFVQGRCVFTWKVPDSSSRVILTVPPGPNVLLQLCLSEARNHLPNRIPGSTREMKNGPASQWSINQWNNLLPVNTWHLWLGVEVDFCGGKVWGVRGGADGEKSSLLLPIESRRKSLQGFNSHRVVSPTHLHQPQRAQKWVCYSNNSDNNKHVLNT